MQKDTTRANNSDEGFTVAPSFNTRPSSSNLSAMANEINFIDLDALFAGKYLNSNNK